MRVSTILSLLSFLSLAFALYTEIPIPIEGISIGEGFAIIEKGEGLYLLPFDNPSSLIPLSEHPFYWAGKRAYLLKKGALVEYSSKGTLINTYRVPVEAGPFVVKDGFLYVAEDEGGAVVKLGNKSEVVNILPYSGTFKVLDGKVVYITNTDTFFPKKPDFSESFPLGLPLRFLNGQYFVDKAGYLHIIDPESWKVKKSYISRITAAGGPWAVGWKEVVNLQTGERFPTRGVLYFDYAQWKGLSVFASPSSLLFLSSKPVVEKVFEEKGVLGIAVWKDKLYVFTSEGLLIYTSLEGCYLPLPSVLPKGTYKVKAHYYPQGKVEYNIGEGWVKKDTFKITVSGPTRVECRFAYPRKEQRPWEVVNIYPLEWMGDGSIRVVQRPSEVRAGQRVRLYLIDGRTNETLEDVNITVEGDSRIVDEYVDLVLNDPGIYRVVVSKEGYTPVEYEIEVKGTSPLLLILGILGGLLLIGAAAYYYIVYVRAR